jgi:hypothetical protein
LSQAQAGLELMIPPASASQVLELRVCHRAKCILEFLRVPGMFFSQSYVFCKYFLTSLGLFVWFFDSFFTEQKLFNRNEVQFTSFLFLFF